jgi:hypothetical protein
VRRNLETVFERAAEVRITNAYQFGQVSVENAIVYVGINIGIHFPNLPSSKSSALRAFVEGLEAQRVLL